MRISHRLKFVFISIPKTATTSIRRILTPYSDVLSGPEFPFYHHVTALQLREHFRKKGWDWNSYFKFAFVRNPWDRMVSHFAHIEHAEWLIGIRKYGDFRSWCLESPEEYARLKNPPLWCLRNLLIPKGIREKFSQEEKHIRRVWTNHLDWITDEDGELLIDFCGRYERLAEDFSKIAARAGIARDPLPRLDYDGTEMAAPRHRPYREYYDARTREWVAERFARDIAAFLYEF